MHDTNTTDVVLVFTVMASSTPYRVGDAFLQEWTPCLQDVLSYLQEWTVCNHAVHSLLYNKELLFFRNYFSNTTSVSVTCMELLARSTHGEDIV